MSGRQHFQGIDDVALFYAVAAAALAVFAWGLARRVRRWRAGPRGASVPPPSLRLRRALRHGLSALVRLPGDPAAALMHGLIAVGFTWLFVGTVLATIDQHVVRFLEGPTYLVYSLALDLAGLALLVGLLGAAARRYVARIPRLDSGGQDAAVLLALAVVAGSGFAVEGLRLAADTSGQAHWSPLGSALGGLFGTGAAADAYPGTWWFHALASLALVAALPWTRLFHVFAAPVHLAVADEPAHRVPLEDRPDDAPPLAVRDVVALDACTRCGRCVEVCPAAAAGEPFSPRAVLDAARGVTRRAAPADGELGLLGSATLAWHCTTCRACLDACPISIAPAAVAAAARRVDVEDGTRVPVPLAETLDRLQRYGNPWEASRKGRSSFHKELDLPDLSRDAGERLTWVVGCTAAIDTRARAPARAFSRLANAAGLTVGTLGRMVGCCGDVAAQLGEEGLFEDQAEKLGAAFDKAGASDVVASSPHCLASMKQGALAPRVRHTSEVLDEALADGSLRLPRPVPATVTFHDPCYLGRHGGVFEPPRRLIDAIDGVQRVEMERSRQTSRCCGAGGGRMWVEDLDGPVRMSELRVSEAAATGADLLVVACPLCLVMLSDASKAAGVEGSLEVIDLSELLARALPEVAEEEST